MIALTSAPEILGLRSRSLPVTAVPSEPTFELDSMSHGKWMHWRPNGGYFGVKAWAMGQGACVREAALQLAERVKDKADAELIAIVQKEVKKRRDAIEQYEKGGRAELAAKEKQEIVVLESFLPKPLGPEELDQH